MPFLGLRHAEQRVDLRKHNLQGAAIAQHLEKHTGAGLAQRLFGFLPYALGHQGVYLSLFDHLAHQGQGFRSHLKSQRGETRGEAREPQDPHRIFDEGGRNMAQHAGLQVALPAERVDERPIAGLRDGIDGQIAPREILLETDFGPELDRKAAISGRSLSLAASQRIFFVGLRMQEHREVAAHFAIFEAQQLIAGAPDHHPVAFLDG